MTMVRPTITIDFPPNLEDGEFWLPSNVFLKIVSLGDDIDHHNVENKKLRCQFKRPSPTNYSLKKKGPPLRPFKNEALKMQVYEYTYPGEQPNVKPAIEDGLPSIEDYYYYYFPSWIGSFQFMPAPYLSHFPIYLTHEYQGLENNGSALLVPGNPPQGTEVFLPCGFVKSPPQGESEEEEDKVVVGHHHPLEKVLPNYSPFEQRKSALIMLQNK